MDAILGRHQNSLLTLLGKDQSVVARCYAIRPAGRDSEGGDEENATMDGARSDIHLSRAGIQLHICQSFLHGARRDISLRGPWNPACLGCPSATNSVVPAARGRLGRDLGVVSPPTELTGGPMGACGVSQSLSLLSVCGVFISKVVVARCVWIGRDRTPTRNWSDERDSVAVLRFTLCFTINPLSYLT